MTDATTKKHQSFYQPGELGMMLRHYREQAGMEIEQIAEELCLSPSAVVALENENFSTLPEPPYVRGYLRSYARLASMDGKELIGMYESMRRDAAKTARAEEQEIPAKSKKKKRIVPTKTVSDTRLSSRTEKKKGAGKKLLVIVAVLALLLLLLWMFASGMFKQSGEDIEPMRLGDNEAVELSDVGEGSASPELSGDEKTGDTEPSSSISGLLGAASAPNTEADESGQNNEKAQADKDDKAVQLASAEAEVKQEASSPAIQVKDVSVNPADVAEMVRNMDKEKLKQEGAEDKQAETETAKQNTENNNSTEEKIEQAEAAVVKADEDKAKATADDAQTGESEDNPITTENIAKVRLVFKDDAWVEMWDKEEQRIMYELVRKGEEREFDASNKPFKFKIGNSYGVKIYKDDELFNHTPYIKPSGTANFTLE